MNTCETCKAFDLGTTSCRAHPPVFCAGLQGGVFPCVYGADWCLEWQSKEKKEPVKRGERDRTVVEYVYACEVKGLSPVSEKHREFAKTLGIDPGPEWGKFKNYCLAHDKRYANYEAAFRNWLASPLNQNGGKR